jgi:adenosylcobyric acid synthase
MRARGRALMVQGTSSHVGKSVLVAGLCRLLHQDGLQVAPFKSQNMALNSFATQDGREIGRAQAAQAEAAGIAPTVDMNPILLKPEGNRRSQVVVAGQVYRSMSAREYDEHKETLWPLVEASLSRLLAAYDIVVIEGAGSPVEMNLRATDIVNMRVAHAADAPVLLVADIDRGGIFAALVGTMALLDPDERARVAGFVVNKFRGDPSLFTPGIDFLEQRLERPVFGVVPWIEDLGIAEEDSLGLPRATGHDESGESGSLVDIALIRLPRIANFDDFAPLAAHPAVRLRYVERAEDFGSPDLVILPGTKTTRSDLDFVRGQGLAESIATHTARGGAVLGICGGYQMLGQRIDDPDGLDGPAGTTPGLGLLAATTHFAREKATVQVQGHVAPNTGMFARAAGAEITAYEIHMGRTEADEMPLFTVTRDGESPRPEGAVSRTGQVLGTYLHGLFANPVVTGALVSDLATRKGLAVPVASAPRDAYDHLADVLRGALAMDRLRKLIGAS